MTEGPSITVWGAILGMLVSWFVVLPAIMLALKRPVSGDEDEDEADDDD